ncbi:hypothetical protein F4819DRAFT_433054 [Hypoxylon fuscum]|nr:hypothetical protein F4819DRAFT_433054 [Hypoxylon fuscum]
MSVRPSSSRGPSPKSSASSTFKYDKRISRDDSFVNLRTGAGAGFKTHMFARGQLPTPETSPRSSRKASIPTLRMPTPDSLNDGHATDIGMALGSPTRTPVLGGLRTPQSSLRAHQTSTPALVSPASGISIAESHDKPLHRKQSGKWKLFSRFGKKPSDHPHSEPKAQKSTPRPGQAPDVASQPWYESKVERSNTVGTRGNPRHKPIVIRSQTMPYEADGSAQASRSKSDGKETFGRIPIGLDTNASSSGPLLDVEIPQITMERYSVMFGSVLQSQSSQPSLLARRQATIQKLKSIEDAVEMEEEVKHHIPRRATSPQPMKDSPTFALFPPTPAKRLAPSPLSNASPRLRSNTSPALLPSPSKANFNHVTPHGRRPSNDVQKSHDYKAPAVHPNQKGKLTIATLAREREQQAVARDYQFSPDSSNLILESPTDVSSPEFEIVRSESVRRVSYTQEPKWQMMTPPQHTPSTASTSVASDRKPSPSSPATSAHSNLSQASQDVDEMLEKTSNMNPVELSIARQISVSREQRKLLKPLQTSFAVSRSRPSPSKTSPMPKIAMGKNERLVETKSSTPTFIIPEETNSPHLAQHRKSERVVLEGA